MIGLIGIEATFPYPNMNLVGALLFAQYPTTLVYSDNSEFPIIKEWVDCSDDNKIDRYFYYKTDKINLKKFIEGEEPHLDLINSSIEPFVIFQDIKDSQTLRTCIVSIKSIPAQYKPQKDFLFDIEDGVDTIKIIDYFKLDEIDLSISEVRTAKEVSKTYNSETIYFHMKKGRGVGYGTVNTEIFAKTLMSFDKLYKNIALDCAVGIERGDVQLDAQKNADLLKYTTTEIFSERIAASYGFFIRPVAPQIGIFDESTETENIASKIFELLDDSKTIEVFESNYSNYSGFTLQSYKVFLETVYKSELSFELNWFNPLNDKQLSDEVNYRKATDIITNIDKLTTTGIQQFTVRGKFRAVNCDTRHYNFTGTNDQQYSGYFDKAIKEAAESVNFINLYEIKISRTITKDPAKAEETIKDTIISCVRDYDNDGQTV